MWKQLMLIVWLYIASSYLSCAKWEEDSEIGNGFKKSPNSLNIQQLHTKTCWKELHKNMLKSAGLMLKP